MRDILVHDRYESVMVKSFDFIIHDLINYADKHDLHHHNFLDKLLWLQLVSYYCPCHNFEHIKSSERNLVDCLLDVLFYFLRLLLFYLYFFNLSPDSLKILSAIVYNLLNLVLLIPVNLEEQLHFLNLFC